MAMQCELSVDPSLDPVHVRALILRLQEQVNASGKLRASPGRSGSASAKHDLEYKSDSTLLYTLAVVFVQSGAAKSLIEAIRAVLSGTRDKSAAVTLRLGGKPIKLDRSILTDNTVKQLVADIEQQVSDS